jgi:hypothetical protein
LLPFFCIPSDLPWSEISFILFTFYATGRMMFCGFIMFKAMSILVAFYFERR